MDEVRQLRENALAGWKAHDGSGLVFRHQEHDQRVWQFWFPRLMVLMFLFKLLLAVIPAILVFSIVWFLYGHKFDKHFYLIAFAAGTRVALREIWAELRRQNGSAQDKT